MFYLAGAVILAFMTFGVWGAIIFGIIAYAVWASLWAVVFALTEDTTESKYRIFPRDHR